MRCILQDDARIQSAVTSVAMTPNATSLSRRLPCCMYHFVHDTDWQALRPFGSYLQSGHWRCPSGWIGWKKTSTTGHLPRKLEGGRWSDLEGRWVEFSFLSGCIVKKHGWSILRCCSVQLCSGKERTRASVSIVADRVSVHVPCHPHANRTTWPLSRR